MKVFLKGNDDLVDSLLPADDGGKLPGGLAGLLRERYAGKYEAHVIHETCGDSTSLREELAAALAGKDWPAATRLVEVRPDLIVFSLHGDLLGAADAGTNPEEFTKNMLTVTRLLKEQLEAHMIFFNASTIEPGQKISNYRRLEQEPFSIRAHKLDLALMELSVLEGISIIDADRLLAELGAARHVMGPLDYSAVACEALCQELLRVAEDYGFFEERPLVMQVGQKKKRV